MTPRPTGAPAAIAKSPSRYALRPFVDSRGWHHTNRSGNINDQQQPT
jgi:hypothetical protein